METMPNTIAQNNNYSIKCPIELCGVRQKPTQNFRYRKAGKYGMGT